MKGEAYGWATYRSRISHWHPKARALQVATRSQGKAMKMHTWRASARRILKLSSHPDPAPRLAPDLRSPVRHGIVASSEQFRNLNWLFPLFRALLCVRDGKFLGVIVLSKLIHLGWNHVAGVSCLLFALILLFWDTVLWILLWNDCVRTWSPRFSGCMMLFVLLFNIYVTRKCWGVRAPHQVMWCAAIVGGDLLTEIMWLLSLSVRYSIVWWHVIGHCGLRDTARGNCFVIPHMEIGRANLRAIWVA